jgi:hypothetical protein
MDRDSLVALIIATLAAAIIGAHLTVSIVVWKRFPGAKAVLLLLGLSIVTAVVWFLIASTVSLFFLWSSDSRGVPNDVYFATFDILIHPCSGLDTILGDLSPGWCGVMPYLVGPTAFFSLSVLASPAYYVKHSNSRVS